MTQDDDLDVAEPEYGGRPGLATTICALLLIASCAGAQAGGSAVASREGAIGYVVGGAVTGLFLWGIAYAITIRRASPRWKVGSAIALAVLGLLVAFFRVGETGAARSADLQATKQSMTDFLTSDGKAPPRPAADAGPLTRMGATAMRMRTDDAHAFEAEAKDAGMPLVLNFQGLTKTSPVLDHCDRIAALEASAARHGARFPDLLAAVRAEGLRDTGAGQPDRGIVDEFLRGATTNRANFERQWTLVGSVARDAAALCRVLARRHWKTGSANEVLFTSAADLAEAQPLLARVKANGAELQRIETAARASARRQLGTIPSP